jgi:hypothetical protein
MPVNALLSTLTKELDTSRFHNYFKSTIFFVREKFSAVSW